jgi:hypothetical protein
MSFITSRKRRRFFPLAAVLLAAGCAAEMREAPTEAVAARGVAAAAPATAPPGKFEVTDGTSNVVAFKADAEAPRPVPRKIIYNARVTLVVESITSLSDQLARLVKESGGYVAETDQSSYTHVQRTASWTVRVPVERFDGFLDALGRLGEVQQSHLDSQDVTQEYYDVEARITNKQQEEKRLLKHLEESTGKLEDILKVEKELTRVRGEIEMMQGRIRYLANLSALSTVTITATEVRNYTPPVEPTFATQVARTFRRSVETLTELGKAVVLAAVAVAPWVPLLVVMALPFVILWRRAVRRPPVVLTRTGPGAPLA